MSSPDLYLAPGNAGEGNGAGFVGKGCHQCVVDLCSIPDGGKGAVESYFGKSDWKIDFGKLKSQTGTL